MKGMIFTGFLAFIEQKYGPDFLEEMLEAVPLSTGGAYTNIGNYSHVELLDMLQFVKAERSVELNAFVHEFGCALFAHLVESFPSMMERYSDSFQLIHELDQTIHKNVVKLYPEAEVPQMDARISDDGAILTLQYHSSRPFMYVALGLMDGCINHFGDSISIEMLDQSNGKGNHAQFILTRHDRTRDTA